jgi:hypothetical protein
VIFLKRLIKKSEFYTADYIANNINMDKLYTEVFVNPNPTEFGICKNASPSVRGLLDNGKLYIWNTLAFHGVVSKNMNISDKYRVEFFSNDQIDVTSVDADLSQLYNIVQRNIDKFYNMGCQNASVKFTANGRDSCYESIALEYIDRRDYNFFKREYIDGDY